MMFQGIRPSTIGTEELSLLVSRAQSLTKGGYDLYDQNYEVLSALVKKILPLAKQEKEWYLYFDAIYELFYLDKRNSNYIEIVKYAEVYYKDSALYMDREIPNYPGTTMSFLNPWIYHLIFTTYRDYCQIDDAKMELFMKNYKEAVFKYGKIYEYYNDEMSLSILYRDIDRTKAAARNFVKYEKEMKSCYICGHLHYLSHFLLIDQNKKAEELMLDFIHKNIPQKHLWCYQYCENAQLDSMYEHMIYNEIQFGKIEGFHYFYETYWEKLPRETQWNTNSSSFARMLCVYSGWYDGVEEDLHMVVEDMENEKKSTTIDNMQSFLQWWCYFSLLDRGGIHTVLLSLPGLEPDEQGQITTLAACRYMEEKADEYGRKFSQVRAQFDYDFIKSSYAKAILPGDLK